jgi:hypothetical protein
MSDAEAPDRPFVAGMFDNRLGRVVNVGRNPQSPNASCSTSKTALAAL